MKSLLTMNIQHNMGSIFNLGVDIFVIKHISKFPYIFFDFFFKSVLKYKVKQCYYFKSYLSINSQLPLLIESLWNLIPQRQLLIDVVSQIKWPRLRIVLIISRELVIRLSAVLFFRRAPLMDHMSELNVFDTIRNKKLVHRKV